MKQRRSASAPMARATQRDGRRVVVGALASPVGVLISIPLLVAAAGAAVLLLARAGTRHSNEVLVQRHLAELADAVARDVGFALDQAAPLLARLAPLAEAASLAEVAVTLTALSEGHAGVSHLSVSFPDGRLWASYYERGRWLVHETNATRQLRTNYEVVGTGLVARDLIATTYDPRERPFFQHARTHPGRSWTPPRTYYSTHTTGISAVDALVDANGQLRAVLTVDFDINVLSSFIHHTTLPGARSAVITQDGAVLVYTDGTQRVVPPATERLLRIEDTGDPLLIRGLTEPLPPAMLHPQQRTVQGPGGEAWLRVTPIAGVRAGIATPLQWYVVTVVPTRALLAPARSVVHRTIVVALLALGGALGLAMLLAANLVGLRKRVQLATSQVQLMGSYRLLEKIGVGGMGEVWRAQHELLARDAAVKLLRYAGSDAPAVRDKVEARFRREAQVVAQMRSRHTIELYDYGVAADGTLYFAMELLDGLDFDTLVRRFGPQPWPRVCHLLQQACASLAEAHDHGLFHRDIKPANLFTCRAADEVDIVKVLDFGIVHVAALPPLMEEPAVGQADAAAAAAAATDEAAPANGASPMPATTLVEQAPGIVQEAAPSPGASVDAAQMVTQTAARSDATLLTLAGAMVGTPGYMSPEQILGQAIDGRSDLYGLGCVAWWLLTGQTVFAADLPGHQLHWSHVYEELPDIQALVPCAIPSELAALITACLAKHASQRPEDARACAAALANVVAQAGPQSSWNDALASAWWSSYWPRNTPAAAASAAVRLLRAPGTRVATAVTQPAAAWPGADHAEARGADSLATPTVVERRSRM